MKNMNILIACEMSGIVRDSFAALCHNAWSCDLLPSERPGNHFQEDIESVLHMTTTHWDLMIAFPPCTDLAVSGSRWFKEKIKDGRQQRAIDFFMLFINNDCPKIAIENPVGIMSSIYRKPDQIINPWQFGDSLSKKTCLWLKGLPKLIPTNIVSKGEQVTFSSGKKMPKWYSDAWKLPKEERAKMRSRTFEGIAKAMANQWGKF